jgi:hypothetical protein
MNTIREVLIQRDNMLPAEADSLIEEARDEALDMIANDCDLEVLEALVADYFGLEPDYVVELLG